MRKTLFIILAILIGSSGSFAQSGKIKTERTKLEGTWSYQDAQLSYITREANKATEKLGEVDVTIQYEIRWKDGLNHDLVVTKIITGANTPDVVKTSLYKVGDVLQVTVLEVTGEYYKYNLKYKAIDQRDQFLFKIAKEQQKRYL